MVLKMGKGIISEQVRVRKGSKKAEEREVYEAKHKEDEYWKEAELTNKSRSAKKREKEAAKQAKAAAKKAGLRQLAKQEKMDLARVASSRVSKVKQADLIQRREEERATLKLRAEEEKNKQALIGDELVYEPNTNRDNSVIQARNVDDAIAKLTSNHTLHAYMHPEKRIKASFKAFEKEELIRLKEEKPGLTMNQYKDVVLKLWHREFSKLF